MRQTETDMVLPTEAGRSAERPVSVSECHHYAVRTGDGSACLAAIGARAIVISRPIGGLACRVRLSPEHYSGLSILGGPDGLRVRLVHREPGLTLDLPETADFRLATEQRDRLAEMLGLPVIDSPNARIGNAEGRRPVGRQLSRPRFLKRRLTGSTTGRMVSGREIIAPE